MFSKPLDPKLKGHLYINLTNDPETNVPKVIREVTGQLRQANWDYVKDVMRIIKYVIKDKIRAKPKYFALVLLKELMRSREKQVVEYFVKKLLSRLAVIAQFEIKNPDPNRGIRCLKNYFNGNDEQNNDYSLRFFMLLLECWKNWDQMYSKDFPKIREKCEKLRRIFPKNEIYYSEMSESAPVGSSGVHQSGAFPPMQVSAFGEALPTYESETRQSQTDLAASDVQQLTYGDNLLGSQSQARKSQSNDQLSAQIERSQFYRKMVGSTIRTSRPEVFLKNVPNFQLQINNLITEMRKIQAQMSQTGNVDFNKMFKLQKELEAIGEIQACLTGLVSGRMGFEEVRAKVALLEGEEASFVARSAQSINFPKPGQSPSVKEDWGSAGDEGRDRRFEANEVMPAFDPFKATTPKDNLDYFKPTPVENQRPPHLRYQGVIIEESEEEEESKIAANSVYLRNNPAADAMSNFDLKSTQDFNVKKGRTTMSQRNMAGDIQEIERIQNTSDLDDRRVVPETHQSAHGRLGKRSMIQRVSEGATLLSDADLEKTNSEMRRKNTMPAFTNRQSPGKPINESDFEDLGDMLPDHYPEVKQRKSRPPPPSQDEFGNRLMGTIVEEPSEFVDESRRSGSRFYESRQGRTLRSDLAASRRAGEEREGRLIDSGVNPVGLLEDSKFATDKRGSVEGSHPLKKRDWGINVRPFVDTLSPTEQGQVDNSFRPEHSLNHSHRGIEAPFKMEGHPDRTNPQQRGHEDPFAVPTSSPMSPLPSLQTTSQVPFIRRKSATSRILPQQPELHSTLQERKRSPTDFNMNSNKNQNFSVPYRQPTDDYEFNFEDRFQAPTEVDYGTGDRSKNRFSSNPKSGRPEFDEEPVSPYGSQKRIDLQTSRSHGTLPKQVLPDMSGHFPNNFDNMSHDLTDPTHRNQSHLHSKRQSNIVDYKAEQLFGGTHDTSRHTPRSQNMRSIDFGKAGEVRRSRNDPNKSLQIQKMAIINNNSISHEKIETSINPKSAYHSVEMDINEGKTGTRRTNDSKEWTQGPPRIQVTPAPPTSQENNLPGAPRPESQGNVNSNSKKSVTQRGSDGIRTNFLETMRHENDDFYDPYSGHATGKYDTHLSRSNRKGVLEVLDLKAPNFGKMQSQPDVEKLEAQLGGLDRYESQIRRVDSQERLDMEGERVVKIEKISEIHPRPSDKFSRMKTIIDPLDDEREKEMVNLRVCNDYLKDQIGVLQSRVIEKNRQIGSLQTMMTDQGAAEPKEEVLPLEEQARLVEAKLVERKNDLLIRENQFLKRLNLTLKSNRAKAVSGRSEKPALVKQLNNQLCEYVQELKKELEKERSANYRKQKRAQAAKDKMRRYQEELEKLKLECKQVVKMATEGDETVRTRVGQRIVSQKSHLEFRTTPDGTMKNTVYIKDVESLIMTDNEEDQVGEAKRQPAVRDLLRPDELLKSVATVKMPAADQINSQFVAMMNRKRMEAQRQTQVATQDDIYRVFYENVETYRASNRSKVFTH